MLRAEREAQRKIEEFVAYTFAQGLQAEHHFGQMWDQEFGWRVTYQVNDKVLCTEPFATKRRLTGMRRSIEEYQRQGRNVSQLFEWLSEWDAACDLAISLNRSGAKPNSTGKELGGRE